MYFFFTVDVESYSGDYGVEVRGRGKGLDYLLATLKRFGLRATFFVEALGGTRWGIASLKEICQLIVQDGHEVQLHLHPKTARVSGFQPITDQLWRYDASVQQQLIRTGLEVLSRCGIGDIRAFRAGDLAADQATLEVIRDNGIFLSSNRDCDTRHVSPRINHLFPVVNDASLWNMVKDIPVSAFRSPLPFVDGRYRHLEICALGTHEMISVLEKMVATGYRAATLLTHPGEFFRVTKNGTVFIHKNCRRLEHLLEFLAGHGSIQVALMGEAGAEVRPLPVTPPDVWLPPMAALVRCMEQFATRLAARSHGGSGIS